MIFDSSLIFSGATGFDGTRTAQAITGTTLSTNVLDTRNSTSPSIVDESTGSNLWLVLYVQQAFNNLTSLTVSLESDSSSSLAVAPAVHAAVTMPLARLASPGQVWAINVPSADVKRYLGVRYTVNGAAPSQGSLFAFMTPTPQRNTHFASGLNFAV